MPPATTYETSAPAGAHDLTPLGHGVAETTLEALRDIARPMALSPGEAVLHQGDEPKIVIVLDGLVAARRTSSSGRGLTFALIGPGHAFGLMAMWRPSRSRFDLVALSPARALLLPGPEVLRLAAHDAGLAVALLDVAMVALGVAYERLDAASFETARSRLARTVLAYGTVLTGAGSRISRAELAGLIGTSREMLDRVFRDLESQSILCRRGRRIAVMDRAALERIAGWTGERRERAHWLRVFLD